MAYNTLLAENVRQYLKSKHVFPIVEKKMFGGLAFMVNGKMCINISGNNLMCRFNPRQTEELTKRIGYKPMIMKNRNYKGYCYVEPIGFDKDSDFEFWVDLCLAFNKEL